MLGLRATLKGAEIEPVVINHRGCNISVVRNGDKFQIDRPCVRFTAQYRDYVDTLNELLLQVVYELMGLLPEWELLHCSAVETVSGENLVAFGNKRAGKSVWAFSQTLTGGRLLADDLLAWDQKRSRFMCFGIASRLRRPIEHRVFETLTTDAFIPGERLSYVKHTHLNLAPCGELFLPDAVIQIEAENHSATRLPAIKTLARIRQSCIPRTVYS